VSALCNHSLELTGLAGDPASPVHRLDPRAKIIGALAITGIAVSTPPALWPVYLACALALLAIAIAGRVPVGDLWRRGRLPLALVAAVAVTLPFVRDGGREWALAALTVHVAGVETAAAVAAKGAIGIAVAVLLTCTTGFAAVLGGLRALRVPNLLVLVAGLMYRYLFVIVEEIGRLRASLASRGYRPRHALHAAVLGRVAASSFVRTYERGERVHRAMLARGYRGELPELEPPVLRLADVVVVAGLAGSLLALRITIGVTLT
jgi:cobalt/nickel transport system permease protein